MSKRLLAAILVFMLALSGCAGFDVKHLDRGKPLKVPDEAALVFGKVILTENGKTTAPYSIWSGEPVLSLLHVESGRKSYRPVLESDGSFYWIVPRGTYIVSKVAYHGYVFQPRVAFQAPFGADAYYLGTLIIDVDVGRHLLGEYYLKKVQGVRVEDGFDAAKAAIIDRNPELPARMEKNLMVHSESIPIDPELQKKKALGDILSILGMAILIQYNIQFP